MTGILVTIEPADRDKVRQAAEESGLSQREFCRRAILSAAGLSSDLRGMVQEIHRRVCGAEGALPPADREAQDARAALVQMGWAEAQANRRVNQITSKDDTLTAADIIAAALKERTGQ